MPDPSTWGWQDVEGVITLAGLMGTVLVGGIGYGVLQQKVARATEDAKTALAAGVDVQKDLAAFRADAERRFVTDETLARVEERIVGAIERLGDRLDRVIDRRVPE